MYLLSKVEEVVALLVPETTPIALPPPLDETGIIIMKAVQLLREKGWTPGTLYDSRGYMCAMGALYMAISGHPSMTDDNSHPAIHRVIRHLGVSSVGEVESWNDRQVSGDVVIAMLESAARYVR